MLIVLKNIFRRAMLIKSECDEKLEDAKQSQLQQANLVERLRVRIQIFQLYLLH